ncbi:hypothetical protein C8J57DRAFT_1565392 [Mycena rebaudengoi]|nr:hypothetical protein C8J57DRAFT_1565392 [Mycena rebaudengoi]
MSSGGALPAGLRPKWVPTFFSPPPYAPKGVGNGVKRENRTKAKEKGGILIASPPHPSNDDGERRTASGVYTPQPQHTRWRCALLPAPPPPPPPPHPTRPENSAPYTPHRAQLRENQRRSARPHSASRSRRARRRTARCTLQQARRTHDAAGDARERPQRLAHHTTPHVSLPTRVSQGALHPDPRKGQRRHCYTVNLRKGLVPIQDSVRSLELDLTTPPENSDNTPSQIAFSDDGKRLFASVKGRKDSAGFLAVWTVNDDGSLSKDFEKNTPDGGQNPASLTLVRGADALMNTDIGNGINIFDFGNGSAKAVDTQSLKLDGSKHTAWGEFSDATRNYYIMSRSDSDTEIYTEISIDPESLEVKLVNEYPQRKGSFPIDQEVALIDGKDTSYLLFPGSMTIEILSLVKPGAAEQRDAFDIARAAKSIGATLNAANIQGIQAFFTG